MKKRYPSYSLILSVAFITSANPYRATADDESLVRGRAELQRAIVSNQSRPSFDTVPVEFTIGGIHYRMPRNYLVTMTNWNGDQQGLVGVRVNLPGLKPITPETRECFEKGSLAGTPGCDPILFWINSRGSVSADEIFANNRRIFRNQTPIDGPFGYEEYEIGPENARTEEYRKVEGARTLLYSCQIFDNHGVRDGLCSPRGDRISTGGEIQFYLSLRHLAEIDRIDASLRKLVEKFTVLTGEGK